MLSVVMARKVLRVLGVGLPFPETNSMDAGDAISS